MTVRGRGRSAWPGMVVLTVVLNLAAGCTSGGARPGPVSGSASAPATVTASVPVSGSPSVPADSTAPVSTGVPGVPAADAAAVRTAVTSFNSADGSVSGQQRVLSALVDPAQRDIQARCPAPTATLEFQPVWTALAPSPSWTPSAGSLTGTVYSLPTLIRIHRAGRVSGTDLTDLHVSVSGAAAARNAHLVALCIS